jgi:acyl dehydratase
MTTNPHRELLQRLAMSPDEVLATSDWIPVTAAEADIFDRLTGREVDFRSRAPGPHRSEDVGPFQVLALISRFAAEAGVPVATDAHVTMLHYGFDDVRWTGAVPPGSTIRSRVVLAGCDERSPGQFLIRHCHSIEVKGGSVPVLEATALGLAILL